MAGFIILHCSWHDMTHLEEYQAAAAIALEEFGAKSVVYDVRTEVVEGKPAYPATIIWRFKDLETAKAWYHSPGYQKVLPLRLAGSEGVARFAESVNEGRK